MNADEELVPPEGDASNVGIPDPALAKCLVRVGSAGIGGSGVHVLNPTKAMVPLPLTLGRDAAGFVEKLGPGVKGPEGAQTVLEAGTWGCATCVACVSGRDSACEYWARRPSTMLDGGGRVTNSGAQGVTATAALDTDAARPEPRS